jgi:hypothetical protein
MAQSLDQLKRQLRERLTELQPLVDEYAQLERAAAALGDETAAAPDAARPAKPARSRKPSATSSPRAPRGANKTAVLATIDERPGVTVGEIAAVTGIAKPLIYNVTRTALGKGEIEPVDLGGGRKGFKTAADATTEPAGPSAGRASGTSLVEATEGIEDPDEPAPVGG